MQKDHVDTPSSVITAFTAILDDFSRYLHDGKNRKRLRISLSRESEKRMGAWAGPGDAGSGFIWKGPADADIFIIDGNATFFDGESGRLLKNILKAMGLQPDQVFICNPADKAAVRHRIDRVNPKVIILLGQAAVRFLLDSDRPMEQVCGRFHAFNGIKVMPAEHPSVLLKRPELKRGVWNGMKQVMACAGLSHDS